MKYEMGGVKDKLPEKPQVSTTHTLMQYCLFTNFTSPKTALVPVLLNIFVGNVDSATECTLSKLADDTKLPGAVDTLEGSDAILRDLDRVERWAHVNLTKFNKAKCKVLHMGQGNPRYQYRLRDEGIESSTVE